MASQNESSESWQRQGELFHEALEREPAERQKFLDEACAADLELRREVEALLAAHAEEPHLLDRVGEMALDLTEVVPESTSSRDSLHATEPQLAAGEVLADRFEIVRLLGRGGMGAVYEAHDRELQSSVAVKILRPEIALGASVQERFRREIHLARQVTHPNACRTFDLFRHGPDLVFLTMELLEGETLAARLQREGSWSPEEALPIVEQIVAALSEAHRVGVIHRDLKSANVMLVPNGAGLRAVVTDFGLAISKRTGEGKTEHITRSGELLGTPAYMAPEQLEGRTTTPATDVYALGLLLYEMVTGELPFKGETPISGALQRLQRKVPSPRQLVPELDRVWERTILRCLEREPEERFEAPGEVVAALKGETVPLRWTPRRRRRWALGGFAAAALAAWALLVASHWVSSGTPTAAEALGFGERDWVLIAGFENRTGEEVLDGTLEHALRRELSSSSHVNVVPHERIADSLRLMKRAEDSNLNPLLAREVCLRDGEIRALITGRIERLGSTYVLDAELIAARDGAIIASFSEDAPGQDDLVAAVRRLSSSVREALGEAIPQIQADERALERVTTPSLRALKLYSQANPSGTDYLDSRQVEALLREAIVEDPEFASAYIGLAHTLRQQGRPPEVYLPFADRAVELAAAVSEWERQLIRGRSASMRGDWEGAIANWETVQRLHPDLQLAGTLMATLAFELARYEDAIPYAVAWARAQPQNLFANMQATRALAIWGDRPAEAEAYFRRALELLPAQEEELRKVGFLGAMAIDFTLLYSHHQRWLQGDLEGALAEVDRVRADLATRRGELHGWLVNSIANGYLTLGRTTAAQEVLPQGANDARLIQAIGDRAEARAFLLKEPERPERREATTAILLVRENLLAEAQRVVDSLVARSEGSHSYPGRRRPTAAAAAVARGALAVARGQTDSGISLLRSSLRQLRASGNSEYFLGASVLANALIEGDEAAAAVKILEEASRQRGRVYPGPKTYWFEVRLQLADLLRELDRGDEANEIEAQLGRLMLFADKDYWLVGELASRRATAATSASLAPRDLGQREQTSAASSG